MKTPSWEPSPGALVAWLNANTQARPIDAWTFTLAGGTVLRYSGGDRLITVNATTWLLGPGLQRQQLRQTIGVAVDSLTLRLTADAGVLVSGTPILQALAKGAFAGATVLLERAFLDDDNACRGLVPLFFGRMGGIRASRSEATIEVRSHAELLDVMIPGDVYQPGCRNTVFDAQCGLSAAAHTVAGSTSTAGDSTRRVLTSTSAAVTAKPTAWADLGLLTFTSGANVGQARTVRSHVLAAGVATVAAVYPFPFAIGAGDSFTLRAGCNKVKDGDCTVKFSNVARFRGEPYIPAPETVL
jgi:uncharacterized phage protein (TIGR02218 family)